MASLICNFLILDPCVSANQMTPQFYFEVLLKNGTVCAGKVGLDFNHLIGI